MVASSEPGRNARIPKADRKVVRSRIWGSVVMESGEAVNVRTVGQEYAGFRRILAECASSEARKLGAGPLRA